MKNSFILIPATVAILTGCKVGPNYRAPRSALPATYSHATSAAVASTNAPGVQLAECPARSQVNGKAGSARQQSVFIVEKDGRERSGQAVRVFLGHRQSQVAPGFACPTIPEAPIHGVMCRVEPARSVGSARFKMERALAIRAARTAVELR